MPVPIPSACDRCDVFGTEATCWMCGRAWTRPLWPRVGPSGHKYVAAATTAKLGGKFVPVEADVDSLIYTDAW